MKWPGWCAAGLAALALVAGVMLFVSGLGDRRGGRGMARRIGGLLLAIAGVLSLLALPWSGGEQSGAGRQSALGRLWQKLRRRNAPPPMVTCYDVMITTMPSNPSPCSTLLTRANLLADQFSAGSISPRAMRAALQAIRQELAEAEGSPGGLSAREQQARQELLRVVGGLETRLTKASSSSSAPR